MKVHELISLLETFPKDRDIIFHQFSEYCIMEKDDIYIQKCCEPRSDGWVPRERPNKPTKEYVCFPGN